jgi:hypothetical protein
MLIELKMTLPHARPSAKGEISASAKRQGQETQRARRALSEKNQARAGAFRVSAGAFRLWAQGDQFDNVTAMPVSTRHGDVVLCLPAAIGVEDVSADRYPSVPFGDSTARFVIP